MNGTSFLFELFLLGVGFLFGYTCPYGRRKP